MPAREGEAARASLVEALQRPVPAIPEGAALADGFVEQSACERRRHQDPDGHGAGGFAEQGDVVGVTAERGDVGFDPAQCRELILQAVIA